MAPEGVLETICRQARRTTLSVLAMSACAMGSVAANPTQALKDATVLVGSNCYGTLISDAGHVITPAHCVLGETPIEELHDISGEIGSRWQGWIIQTPLRKHGGKHVSVNGSPARLLYSGRVAAAPPALDVYGDDVARVNSLVYARGVIEDWALLQVSGAGKSKCMHVSPEGIAIDKGICTIDDDGAPRCAKPARWDKRWAEAADSEGSTPFTDAGRVYSKLVEEGVVYFPKAPAFARVIGAGLSYDKYDLRGMVVRADYKSRIAWAVPLGRIQGFLVASGVDTDPLFSCSAGRTIEVIQ